MKSAVLLVNLGSPASTSIPDVRRYLDQFLMDRYVIDVPWPLRALIVKGVILPTRPPKTAHAYRSIWTGEGSPLIVISQQQRLALEERLQRPVGLAMRYGEPSIPTAVAELAARARDCDRIVVVPLYPQYAMATTKTVEVEAEPALRATGIPFYFVPPFYADERYLECDGSAHTSRLS